MIILLERDWISCIEGIPVIIRFKTSDSRDSIVIFNGIEGIPVIIRFKTPFLP